MQGQPSDLKQSFVKLYDPGAAHWRSRSGSSSVLDSFDALVNDLSIGLPAELKLAGKQYEYYRDRLLTFEEAPRDRDGAGGASRFEPIAVSDESTVVAEFVADPSRRDGYQSEAELEAAFIAQLEGAGVRVPADQQRARSS